MSGELAAFLIVVALILTAIWAKTSVQKIDASRCVYEIEMTLVSGHTIVEKHTLSPNSTFRVVSNHFSGGYSLVVNDGAVIRVAVVDYKVLSKKCPVNSNKHK